MGDDGSYLSFLLLESYNCDIKDFVRSCATCLVIKPSNSKQEGLLSPLSIPNTVWDEISIDFVTSLLRSHGKTAIFVIVDHLSKSVHFVPLKTPYTTTSIAKVFSKIGDCLHGLPSIIVSNCDPLFMSHFWFLLFKIHGPKLHHSLIYHPQSDRQTEVVNRCFQQFLRALSWTDQALGVIIFIQYKFGIILPIIQHIEFPLPRWCTTAILHIS